MKRGVNRFIFVGVVSRDPYKLTGGDKFQRYQLGIRIPEHLGDEDIFEYFDLIVWGDLGDYVYKEIKKGCKVYVEGRIRTRSNKQEFHVSKLNVLGD